MRKHIGWLLAIAGLLFAPCAAHAQFSVPPALFTGPLGHQRYEDGGFFVGFNLMYMKTNRPLEHQHIAKRGIFDLDGTIFNQGPRFFGGSGVTALDVMDVSGPGQNQPGFDIFFGWRFQNGVVVELQWRHLTQARYTAAAALLPPDFDAGNQFENTFLFSPVNNFTQEWAGNPTNIPVGSTASTFGIWNAASLMQIEFVQRYDIYGINARFPIYEGESFRSYGLFGPRIVWIWERFKWRTVDQDESGFADPSTVAIYSNTISNRMYGVHCGCGNDWYLGTTPIGGFAFNLDIEGGLYLDLAKARAAWDREDRGAGIHRSRRTNALTPSAELKTGLWWYPYEGISMQLGYDIQTYFNTVGSSNPIDFNMGTVDPEYNKVFFRWYHGLRVGINFVF